MKKKVLLLGFAGSVISSCTNHRTEPHGNVVPLPISGAGRVIITDSANDRALVDTSSVAVTRNIRKRPHVQITGLFAKNIRVQNGDVVFFTLDSSTQTDDTKKVESIFVVPYHLN